jgi:hypothetical protein
MCYVPNSTLTLISVPHLDDVDCYMLFRNGCHVTFENQDDSKLLHYVMTKGKVVLIGNVALTSLRPFSTFLFYAVLAHMAADIMTLLSTRNKAPIHTFQIKNDLLKYMQPILK